MAHSIKLLIVPFFIVISGLFCIEFTIPIAMGEFFAGIIANQFINLNDIPWINYISHLGLLSIMFLAGLEIDLQTMKKNLKPNLIIGSSSFLAPFIVVVAIGLFYSFTLIQSLVFAIALSATSLAMVFTILKDVSVLSKNLKQTLLGSAMIVDLLSMLFLGFILFDYTLINIIFLCALVFIVYLAKKFLIFIFNRYKGNLSEFELKAMLLVFLGVSIIAENAGLHGGFAAFLFGVTLSGIDPEHNEVIERLHIMVFSLLAPVFFFQAGYQISFNSISIKSLYMIVIFGISSFIFKYCGTYFSIYFLNKKNKTLSRYGALLFNYRLSFGIVAAIYAFEQNILSHNMLNVILIVIAISSLLTVIFKKVFNTP